MKVGRLQFQLHGFLGIFGTVADIAALCWPGSQSAVLCAVITTTLLACSSYELVPHAPMESVIAAGVKAPHREAFKRTIALVHYYNMRIAWVQGWLTSASIYGVLLSGWCLWLAPRKKLFSANTLIFVVPIWLGVLLDAGTQLTMLFQNKRGGVSLILILTIELITLLIAFAFTLAFRGYVSTRFVYAASAGALAFVLVQTFLHSAVAGLAACLLVTVSLNSIAQPAKQREARIRDDTPSSIEKDEPVIKRVVVKQQQRRRQEQPVEETRQHGEEVKEELSLRRRRTVDVVVEEAEEETATTAPQKKKSKRSRFPRLFRRKSSKKKEKENGGMLSFVKESVNGIGNLDDWVESPKLSTFNKRVIFSAAGPSSSLVEQVSRVKEELIRRNVDPLPDTAWIRQSLTVHKHKVDRASFVLENLVAFRRKERWPLRMAAPPLEAALRSGMHEVLPGRDAHGRRVLLYRAAVLAKRDRPRIADLQAMFLLLLERLTLDDHTTQTRGVAYVVDLAGAGISTLSALTIEDTRRGISMLSDAFPCRLRAVYVLNCPTLLRPLVRASLALLPDKLRSRLHLNPTKKKLEEDIPQFNVSYDWQKIVDRLLLAPIDQQTSTTWLDSEEQEAAPASEAAAASSTSSSSSDNDEDDGGDDGDCASDNSSDDDHSQ